MPHEKSAIKRINGIDYPPRDFGFVPDPNYPATWRLLLSEEPGETSLNMLNRAAAALSPGGFHGNRVDIPQSALSSVKRRIRAEYRRLGVDEGRIPNSVKELPETLQDGMMVWKDAETDRYRWFAIYSNNFRDDDDPPEIITQKSQENFVEMVDAGLVDYPEAWLWHVPGTAWGKADWLAYADGFALASGYVYEGKEHIAENLAKEKGLMVSHGMPEPLIVYDPQDPSAILFHVTREISPLPRWKAANKLTGFVVHKGEGAMPLPEDKKSWLKQIGVDDDTLQLIDDSLKSAGDAARSAGIESKEKSGENKETEPVAEAVPADIAAPESAAPEAEAETEAPAAAAPETEEAQEDETAPEYATKEEVAGALSDVIVPLLASIKQVTSDLADARKEIASLKQTDEEKIAATKELTPSRSISEILAQNIIGKDDARVDGRKQLGKDGPVETEVPVPSATPVSFVNGLIQSAQNHQ